VAEPVTQPVPATYAPRAAAALEPVAATPVRAATVLAPQSSQRMLLVTLSGPRAGQRVEVAAHEFWIGSAANNSLCLTEDPAVSGNHACIRREGTIYRLYDNGSLNGTWVNGEVTGASATLLKNGDRITIGHSEFVFQS
jgi:pSer/pThr/pTyr-binding forkhead associated (FHA) protein